MLFLLNLVSACKATSTVSLILSNNSIYLFFRKMYSQLEEDMKVQRYPQLFSFDHLLYPNIHAAQSIFDAFLPHTIEIVVVNHPTCQYLSYIDVPWPNSLLVPYLKNELLLGKKIVIIIIKYVHVAVFDVLLKRTTNQPGPFLFSSTICSFYSRHPMRPTIWQPYFSLLFPFQRVHRPLPHRVQCCQQDD